nr:hypothetical protein [Campylobacter sp. RM13538]
MKSKISLSILVAGLLVCITPADIYAAGGATVQRHIMQLAKSVQL